MADASPLIVSVSGIRGIVGESLTPAEALAFAAALGTHLQGGRVVLSRDSRPSGAMLRRAVAAGLEACGCEIVDLGVVPTPTVGLAIRHLEAAGGIQISASHNPAPWNGLKLFGGDGAVLSPADGAEVKRIFDERAFRWAAWDAAGDLRPWGEAEEKHLETVLRLVDVTRIRSRGLRVFLDANGGAGGPLGKRLLEALQCRPVVAGGIPDGFFAHPPEPLEDNVRDILRRIPEEGADVGFLLDPDADRLAVVDGTGRYIGEELTLALAALARLRHEQGPLVINMSSSRVTEDLAARFGTVCHRAAVGEANVVAEMRRVNALLGGEGNGGVIDPRVGWVRDPFLGMALILDLLAETQSSLGELVAGLPKYSIVKDKATLPRDRLPALYDACSRRWPEAGTNTLDGLRLDWPDRWLHVRPSNTEPIVRFIAEAPTREEAAALCREAASLAT